MKRQRFINRRGTILIAVLVCMGIATTILLGAVQSSLRQRRQMRQELQMEQTKWLLDASVGRAISRLQKQPGYDGETLLVAPALEKYSTATLEIAVVREDQPDNRIRAQVKARLGGLSERTPSMQRSREFVVNTSTIKSQNP